MARYGRGPRAAVAVHCALASGAAWAPVAERLGDLLTVAAPDMPGHGQSPAWDGRGDYQAAVAAGAGALCDGPTLLMGHSFGATAVLRLALERPDLAAGLILIEPVLFAATRGTPVFDALLRLERPAMAALEAGDAEGAARRFTAVWGGGTDWAALTPRQRAGHARRMPLVAAGAAGIVDDVGGILAPGRLEALAVPVLLIAGQDSPPVIAAIQAELARRLPRAHEVTVPGAGHMLPLTHPAAVADAIRAHLTARSG
ncbi:alpha/beta hydrolase [Rhodobacteraceae bacterium CCMM004]|nr:alpha/beta hydrolase [Rhodobacteraceae bacterium CCMM004]